MPVPPSISIDMKAFAEDPYPTYKRLRTEAPIARVPELGAILLSRRDDIAANEKKIEIFSSEQPDGLMNKLMGINMMRKDGQPHLDERKAVFPTISPRTTRDVWIKQFERIARDLIKVLAPQKQADLMAGFAANMAGEVLKITTGLTHVSCQDIDSWSQAMVDGIANYIGDQEIERRCISAVKEIDHAIAIAPGSEFPTFINTQRAAGLPEPAIAANVRLAISGGQNETRDTISGLVWALLTHPEQFEMIKTKQKTYSDAFDEYVRWIAPIGMSPRRVAKDTVVNDIKIAEGDRVFFMFASANRDETVFRNPDQFDLTQDASRHIAFGAGPHFCAGAAIAKTAVAGIAVPLLLDALDDLKIVDDVRFDGWAFRGPTSLKCNW